MKSVAPGKVEGRVKAPASKSMMIRAVAAAALASGRSVISNPTFCSDAASAMECAEALGAKITVGGGAVEIVGGRRPVSPILDCGESGLCIRMFAPICGLFDKEMVLKASGSLMKRDVGLVRQPLAKLGARCDTNGRLPPVKVRGPISGGTLSIDGSQSSQFLTGLLMALPLCSGDSEIEVANLKSKPYVKMTMELLEEFGVDVDADGQLSKFEIAGGQRYKPAKYCVEGDYSGAAFLLVAAAIAGKVTVAGLRQDSLQADKKVVDALELAGAKVKQGAQGVSVETGALSAFEFDASDCPDLLPPLAVLACCCRGKSNLLGAGRLKGKESDRGATLASELGRLGAKISVRGDVMEIVGGRLRGADLESHGDHRIAMACAIAALASEGMTRISDDGCVSKSYPNFFEDLEALRL